MHAVRLLGASRTGVRGSNCLATVKGLANYTGPAGPGQARKRASPRAGLNDLRRDCRVV